MKQLSDVLRVLNAADVEFVIVGSVAAAAHGSPRLTQDVDMVYSRSPQNLQKLVAALAPAEPYLRGAPPGAAVLL